MQFQDEGVHFSELVGVDVQATLCTEYQEFVRADLDLSECWYLNPLHLLNVVHGESHDRPEYLVPEGMVGHERIKAVCELARRFPPKIRLMRCMLVCF